jgi:hypothetical protein
MEQIRERNSHINKMMGINLPLNSNEYSPNIVEANGFYHTDWNWLMRVYRFISGKNYSFEHTTVGYQSKVIIYYRGDIVVQSRLKDNMIEVMWETISDFAKIYNETYEK